MDTEWFIVKPWSCSITHPILNTITSTTLTTTHPPHPICAGFNLFFICLIFAISVFLGASYYVEIFSTRYSDAIETAAAKAVLKINSRSNSIAALTTIALGNASPHSNVGDSIASNEGKDMEDEDEELPIEFDTDDIPGDDAFQEEELDYLLQME